MIRLTEVELTALEGAAVSRSISIQQVVEAILDRRLAEERERIAVAIEAQESCASPAGECYRDHEGCYVADSLRIAREEGTR